MASPPTYRAEPDPEFADRLERRLLRRLTDTPGGLRSSRRLAQHDETARVGTDPDHGADIITLGTDFWLEAPRHRSPRRSLLVAVAAVVVAVAGTLVTVASGDDRERQVDVVAPTPPTTSHAQSGMEVPLLPGNRYFVDPDGTEATPLRLTYQVPTLGWQPWFGAVKYLPGDADGVTGLSITTVSNLVSDGCRDHTPLVPPVGPTVDDLTIALSQLSPFLVTEPPTAVTLLGYHGKHFELTVPDLPITTPGGDSSSKNLAQFTGCVDGELHSWISPINDRSPNLLGHSPDSLGAFNAYQAPGQTEEFWILDIEGTRVVLVKLDSPLSPAADVAERDAIFDSIRIEP